MLDGYGSSCGPFGNNCSPGTPEHLNKAKASRPGSGSRDKGGAGSFVGSVFGAGALSHGVIHVSSASGFGGNLHYHSDGGGFFATSSHGQGYFTSSGQKIHGIWENAATGKLFAFSGQIGGNGQLVLKHMTVQSSNLRGAHVHFSAESSQGLQVSGVAASQWLHSPSHLRGSSLSASAAHAHVSGGRHEGGTDPLRRLRSAQTPHVRTTSVVAANSSWNSYLGAGSVSHHQALLHGHPHHRSSVHRNSSSNSNSNSNSSSSGVGVGAGVAAAGHSSAMASATTTGNTSIGEIEDSSTSHLRSSLSAAQAPSSSVAYSNAYMTNSSIRGDWWDHGVSSSYLNSLYGSPHQLAASVSGLGMSTGGIKVSKAIQGMTEGSLAAAVNKAGGGGGGGGSAEDWQCHGVCYYAPPPSTQMVVGVYHGV